jgi:hypothetical protein
VSRLNRTLGLLLWCALVIGIVALAFGERRVDFWWQLGQGNPVTESDSVPAFGLPHRPFVNEYQLYELSLFVFDRIAGLGAIHAAFVATFLLIFAIPLAAARGLRRDLLSLLLVAVAAIFLINRYEERPEIAAVLLLTVLVFLLTRTRRFSLPFLLAIILLFAIWTNVHSSYLIGLLALGLWLLDRLLLAPEADRWKPAAAGLTLAGACGALLLNPYGDERIVFTFAQENDLGSTILSREMWPAWDQPAGILALMAVTTVVLTLVFARRPRHPAWLLALAASLFVFTLLHIRHMSFLAVALLFLYADRRAGKPEARPFLPGVLALGAACLAVLLFDIVAARNALGDLTASEDAHNRGFAPGLLEGSPPGAVLCHDAEGSYIEGHDPGQFPLLDSGQMHFDDDTKRFYFFAVQDARGFDLALQSLPAVNAVVVTPPVEGWTLAMLDRPGWHLAGAKSCGLLFRRGPGANAADFNLGSLRDEALREGDFVRAFCFSALTSAPRDSLRILDQARVSAWSESFFSFARAWIQKIPLSELQALEQAQPNLANGLLRELVFPRLHPTDPLPPPGPSALEQLARVLTLLDRHEDAGARTLFATVRRPYVSVLYYTLRSRLDPSFLTRESSFERWQDWNAGGVELFQQVTPKLNQRAGDLVKKTDNS